MAGYYIPVFKSSSIFVFPILSPSNGLAEGFSILVQPSTNESELSSSSKTLVSPRFIKDRLCLAQHALPTLQSALIGAILAPPGKKKWAECQFLPCFRRYTTFAISMGTQRTFTSCQQQRPKPHKLPKIKELNLKVSSVVWLQIGECKSKATGSCY